MGNTSSERSALGQEKAQRRDSRSIKEGERPKILMDSPEDADIFHSEDIKVSHGAVTWRLLLVFTSVLHENSTLFSDESQAPLEKEEFLAWQQDLEAEDKGLTLDRPTVFRWTGDGKEVYLSGSFNNWVNKIPLIRRWVIHSGCSVQHYITAWSRFKPVCIWIQFPINNLSLQLYDTHRLFWENIVKISSFHFVVFASNTSSVLYQGLTTLYINCWVNGSACRLFHSI